MDKSTKEVRIYLAFYRVTVFFKEPGEGLNTPDLERHHVFRYVPAQSSWEAARLAYDMLPEHFLVTGSRSFCEQVLLDMTIKP